jgi:hypothetical protein
MAEPSVAVISSAGIGDAARLTEKSPAEQEYQESWESSRGLVLQTIR